MYKKILIALIIIALLVLGGLIAFTNDNGNGNVETQINFLTNQTLKNGDSVEFQLTDSQGNALANQNLKIVFASTKGQPQNFTITTDSQGKGALVLNGEDDGNYTVTVTYDGDNNYKGCSANQKITVGDASVQNGDATSDSSQSTQTSHSSSSSSSDMNYDSERNVQYDSNGIIRGGQNDGERYSDVQGQSQSVDSEGNLI
ncbi:hypothetical protein [Methanobrevibacter sp.]|uniref:hypothetical protein n=1 Tax=Methanobrevibacter sp. TaxID=66852 RepID=UPI00388D7B5D